MVRAELFPTAFEVPGLEVAYADSSALAVLFLKLNVRAVLAVVSLCLFEDNFSQGVYAEGALSEGPTPVNASLTLSL